MVSNGTWDPVSATPAFELLVTGVGDVAVRPMTMTAALAVLTEGRDAALCLLNADRAEDRELLPETRDRRTTMTPVFSCRRLSGILSGARSRTPVLRGALACAI